MRCKNCKDTFEPKAFLQKYCMAKDECVKAYWDKFKTDQAKARKKKAIKNRKVTKQKIEDLEPLSYWIKKCQKVVNEYIRERDKDSPCISCDRPLLAKFDAGHYYSTGAYPELRFLEDNIHGQCVYCNQHLHGNLIEYTERLPNRIGVRAFNELKNLRHKARKYTRTELKEMIVTYKKRTKELRL